jgi:hypothetical protein
MLSSVPHKIAALEEDVQVLFCHTSCLSWHMSSTSPPTHANSFVIGTAVINTHTLERVCCLFVLNSVTSTPLVVNWQSCFIGVSALWLFLELWATGSLMPSLASLSNRQAVRAPGACQTSPCLQWAPILQVYSHPCRTRARTFLGRLRGKYVPKRFLMLKPGLERLSTRVNASQQRFRVGRVQELARRRGKPDHCADLTARSSGSIPKKGEHLGLSP